VYERDNFTCRDCGLKGSPGKGEGSVQAFHLKPIRDGGEHTLDNLLTLCYACRRHRERLRKNGSTSRYHRSNREEHARAAAANGRSGSSDRVGT
jgi:5-methylcytosine-specific restriction endonuclease McrA